MSSFAVVLPTHNRIETLIKAINSAGQQTALPREIVVVDDASEPPVPQSVFDQVPPAVKCILQRNDFSLGAARSRNLGVELSSADYICFLDDDDTFRAQKIECLSKLDLAGVDLIYHPAHIHMVNEGVSYLSGEISVIGFDDFFRKMLIKNRIGGTSMVTVRRETFLEIGGFDAEMPAIEDYELWLRMVKNGAVFLFFPEVLTDYYCVTRYSSLSKNFERNQAAISLMEKKYAEDYKMLTEDESKEYEDWKKSKFVFQYLLNGERFRAIKLQINRLRTFPSLSSFLYLITLFFPLRFIFWIRSIR